MTQTSINVDHIARIEGHGNIHLVINGNRIEKLEMQVSEPARFFESMIRGRDYTEISYIASRICGICSASHVVTDLQAIESIFEVEVSDRTKALRELLIYGSYLQNHATHLFVLAAPDFLGAPSVFPLAESSPELFASALELKALGNELCTKVGGRSIHPITAVVGGFTSEISKEEYLELAEKMDGMLAFAQNAVDLFNSFPISDIKTEGDMLAMVQDDCYPVQSSTVAKLLLEDVAFEAEEVHDYIEEYSVPHSAALFARVKQTKKPYMTAALARINASWKHLSSDAKVAAAKAGLRPPIYNPLRNNVAQAVELVDALERCANIARRLAGDEDLGRSTPVDFKVKAGRGVGYTEAPRGALFHDLELDAEGKVVHASILTPTAQNVANLEVDMYQLVQSLLDQGWEKEAITLEVEKLVRAYDPCLSCSVH